MKLRILKLSIVASAFLLTSCVKKVLDSTFGSLDCVKQYQEYAGAETEGDCADQAEAIQGILDNCSAFLSSEEKAELRDVKAEYEAECDGN